jgi:hypothetical protein
MGTVHWMAPELLAEGRADEKADVYAASADAAAWLCCDVGGCAVTLVFVLCPWCFADARPSCSYSFGICMWEIITHQVPCALPPLLLPPPPPSSPPLLLPLSPATCIAAAATPTPPAPTLT